MPIQSGIREPSTNTISELFENQPMISLETDGMFMPTLRAKAAALYERTYRLASGVCPILFIPPRQLKRI